MSNIIGLITDEGLHNSITSESNGWKIVPKSFGISNIKGDFLPSRTASTTNNMWFTANIGAATIRDGNTIEYSCTVPPNSTENIESVKEIYLIAETSEDNTEFLLGLYTIENDGEIEYNPSQGSLQFRLQVQIQNVDTATFEFNYTQATEIREHNLDTNAHSSTLAKKNHAYSEGIYGVGSTTDYGHLKISDSYDKLAIASKGIAPSLAMVSNLAEVVNGLSGGNEGIVDILAGKQDKLTAGDNISIENNIISATNIDYNDINNVPQINNIVLTETTTSEDLGLVKLDDIYTKGEIDNKIDGMYKDVGTVDTYEDLLNVPTGNMENGSIYTILNTKEKYVFKDGVWSNLLGDFSLSDYLTETEIEDLLINSSLFKLIDNVSSFEVLENINLDGIKNGYVYKVTDTKKYYVYNNGWDELGGSGIEGAVYRPKGSVANYQVLEDKLTDSDSNLTEGDVYNVLDTGANYVYIENTWDKLSETVDLSDYVTNDELASELLGCTHIRSSVSTVVNLNSLSSNMLGDIRKVTSDNSYYIYNNTWDELGGGGEAPDLTGFVTSTELEAILNNYVTETELDSELPIATTSIKGIVQLSTSTTSDDDTLAATPSAVKAVNDIAEAAVPKSGGTMTGDLKLPSMTLDNVTVNIIDDSGRKKMTFTF